MTHGADQVVANAPLIVDLDGTLIPFDTLHEMFVRLLAAKPWLLARAVCWLFSGKAAFKRAVAERVTLDPAILPYTEPFLEWLRTQKAVGRTIWLVTGSDIWVANAIAAYLGLFDKVLASDGVVNLTGLKKAELLTELLGDKGFVYAANAKIDLAVWRLARGAVLVNAPPRVGAAARLVTNIEADFPAAQSGIPTWARALRPHQWVKNTLLFVPLIVSHRMFDLTLGAATGLLFVAFCACASSVYLVNDIMDLEADRRHPAKRHRPLAVGAIQVSSATVVAIILLMAGLGIAAWLGSVALTGLVAYYVLTLLYSWNLKRRMVIDVFTLAGLYMLRVIVGGAAIGIPISHWLLGFSGFIFLSLGFAKRYIELQRASLRVEKMAHGRSYIAADVDMVGMFGITAGFASILILSLYLNSEMVTKLYRTPILLWLWVPAILYWLCRIWLIAHRGHLNDDPVAFAVRDPITYALVIFVFAVLATAKWVDIHALSEVFR